MFLGRWLAAKLPLSVGRGRWLNECWPSLKIICVYRAGIENDLLLPVGWWYMRKPWGTASTFINWHDEKTHTGEQQFAHVWQVRLKPTITEGPAGFQTKNSPGLKKHEGHVATGTAENIQPTLGSHVWVTYPWLRRLNGRHNTEQQCTLWLCKPGFYKWKKKSAGASFIKLTCVQFWF